jgi:hypothetical protein
VGEALKEASIINKQSEEIMDGVESTYNKLQ